MYRTESFLVRRRPNLKTVAVLTINCLDVYFKCVFYEVFERFLPAGCMQPAGPTIALRPFVCWCVCPHLSVCNNTSCTLLLYEFTLVNFGGLLEYTGIATMRSLAQLQV